MLVSTMYRNEFMKMISNLMCILNLLQALNLSDEVEELFVKHFAEDDKRKAMKYLRPTQKKDSHAVTFFIGETHAAHVTTILIR